MKTLVLVLGIILFIVGVQDAIRILIDNQHSSIFSFVPGGFTLHLGLDVALAISGAFLAKYSTTLAQH